MSSCASWINYHMPSYSWRRWENGHSKPERNLKRWNETGTRTLFKAQGSSRAFRSESEMESMRAVLLVFGANDELLSQSRPWNSQPPSAKISTFLMPFYSGKVNFYLMRTLEVATRRQDTAARHAELPIRSCRLLVKNTQVLGNIIALWNLWMKRFASSMSTSAYPMRISYLTRIKHHLQIAWERSQEFGMRSHYNGAGRIRK